MAVPLHFFTKTHSRLASASELQLPPVNCSFLMPALEHPLLEKDFISGKSEKNSDKETLSRLSHPSVARVPLQYKTYLTGLLKIKHVDLRSALKSAPRAARPPFTSTEVSRPSLCGSHCPRCWRFHREQNEVLALWN